MELSEGVLAYHALEALGSATREKCRFSVSSSLPCVLKSHFSLASQGIS